jgi:hypothetical protein
MLFLLALSPAASHADDPWIKSGADGKPQVQLYFFWSLTCPHCTEAHPYIAAIPQARPWVKLHELELTLVLAGLDAFNPCAFFVLLFLLSMLAHQKSRKRMLLIGGVFVLVSGLMYFAFMAAWLNVFQLFGHLAWVTLAAGALAVFVGAVNVKDFSCSKKASRCRSRNRKSPTSSAARAASSPPGTCRPCWRRPSSSPSPPTSTNCYARRAFPWSIPVCSRWPISPPPGATATSRPTT